MNTHTFSKITALALLLMASAGHADGIGYVTVSVVDGEVASHTRGRIAVNQAAGDANQQVNAAAIAISAQAASAAVDVGQKIHGFSGNVPDVAVARIGQNAFAGASGLIAVNQTSGVANAQSNSVAVAMGINGEVGDKALSATLPDAAGLVRAGASSGLRIVGVEDTAFRNARGVVQLNQTAGAGNSSSNNFALRVTVQPDL
jgi:hypothetical protein